MRLLFTPILLGVLLPLGGCRTHPTAPEQPMPAHTVLLSGMLRELSAKPGFTETLLQQLEGAKQSAGKRGPALLTPRLIDELRKRILGKDWEGLDRFPGWTMREINPTVRVATRFLGKNEALEGMSAVHPGAPAPTLNDREARIFLDLGPYTLQGAQQVSLDEPSSLPGFTTQGIVTAITPVLSRGDGPNALAGEHAASQRLADVLNRLSANRLQGAGSFSARIGGFDAHTPEGLVAALRATGHDVRVTDSRYFANFGHLHYKGQDVMMPFWIDTEVAVPHTGGLLRRPRPLMIPVSHAEYEWHIRGPRVNADVSHYFGIDGKAEWRTMDTLDQAWVLKRDAHTYTGADALEVTRLLGLVTVAYMHQHARRPSLTFGGYYTLGVCQDPVSAVERKMTGRSTLFPNTADSSLFDDPQDAEVNALFAVIPKDRAGAAPSPERIFGSLPTAPDAQGRFEAVTIPGLAPDLQAAYAAWHEGTLRRAHGALFYALAYSAEAAAVLLLFAIGWWAKRRRAEHPAR